MAADRAHDIEALNRRATFLSTHADALTDAYNRSTWYRFTAVFFPVPFVLLLLRLHVDYWHYYIFGACYLLFSAALYRYDGRASDRYKAAQQQADEAQRALEQARTG